MLFNWFWWLWAKPQRLVKESLGFCFSSLSKREYVDEAVYPRGFGFVQMPSPEAARKAIEMFNGKPFMKRSPAVSAAKPQSSPRPSGEPRRAEELGR